MRKYVAILLAAVLALTLSVMASAAPDPGTVLPAKGDVNGIGGITLEDVQALYDYLTRGTIPPALSPFSSSDFALVADYNGDGAVDILDYQALYVYITTKNNGGGNSEWSPYV